MEVYFIFFCGLQSPNCLVYMNSISAHYITPLSQHRTCDQLCANAVITQTHIRMMDMYIYLVVRIWQDFYYLAMFNNGQK